MMPKVVYIAGPYTRPDPVENTHRAMKVWNRLFEAGLYPIVPHWSMFQHFLHPRPYEDWMRYDFVLIERCDALLRLPGESSGADREVVHANTHGIPVFDTIEGLLAWAGMETAHGSPA
jgi:nucleoside 2-deoxyribosyltransferase